MVVKVGPNPVRTERGDSDTERDKQTAEGQVQEQDWGDASAGQGTPRAAHQPPGARKRQGRTPDRFQRQHGTADALISGFWPPEL